MDTLIGIVQQLQINESVFYQLIIFIVVFVIAKFTFSSHLQKVLDLREEKTTKLEGSAEARFDEVDKLAADYKSKIIRANREAKAEVDVAKLTTVKAEELRYREEEEQVSKFVEDSRVEFHKELEGKKLEIMKDAQGLADSLVDKVTKG